MHYIIVLSQLHSPDATERDIAAAAVVSCTQEVLSQPSHLQIVSDLVPLLCDPEWDVRVTAAGALRNLAAEGGSIVGDHLARHSDFFGVIASAFDQVRIFL